LFGPPGTEAENDFDFDMDKLIGGVDKALAESTRFRDDQGDEVSSEENEAAVGDEPVVEEPSDEEGHQPLGEQTAGEEEPPGESAPEATPPVNAADPLGLLPPERRAALLAIDEVVQNDPAKRDRVLAALADQPVVPVVPTLPDDIEEGSVAARLWHEQQETRAQLAQIASGQRAQHEAFVKQSAVAAADAAGDEFAARYSQLEPSDVAAIAKTAADSGLVAKLTSGVNPENLKPAFAQALESALWTNEAYRAKVIGTTQTPPVAPAATSESKARKRKLTAVSSAASPTSAPASKRSPLESRVDGRLTPQSRLSVVREMASKLNRDQNEGNY
jgi:hypothetical protein